MNSNSVTYDDKPVNSLPGYNDIITAPEGEWQELVKLVDGNLEFYARVRAHHQKQQEGEDKPKKKKRRSSRSRSRPSKRRGSAADALQARINRATVEALDRVKEKDEEETLPDPPKAATRFIPVNHYSQGTFMLEVPA